MRLLTLVFVVASCQHADSAERSAEIVAKATPAVAPAPPPAPAPATRSCGCGAGMACGDSCGGQCGGGEAVAWTIPEDATWTALHVTGMHCGGCARRIERALAKVQGVVGVKVDLPTAEVKVATAGGIDARRLVSSTIDGLGYHVE
jgi:Cu+-exporting ATPase